MMLGWGWSCFHSCSVPHSFQWEQRPAAQGFWKKWSHLQKSWPWLNFALTIPHDPSTRVSPASPLAAETDYQSAKKVILSLFNFYNTLKSKQVFHCLTKTDIICLKKWIYLFSSFDILGVRLENVSFWHFAVKVGGLLTFNWFVLDHVATILLCFAFLPPSSLPPLCLLVLPILPFFLPPFCFLHPLYYLPPSLSLPSHQ